LAGAPKLLGHFHHYLEEGYYPYVFEGRTNYYEKVCSVVEKTLYEDIATYYRLKTENLHYFKKILYFLSTILQGEISIHKLSTSLGVDDKTTASQPRSPARRDQGPHARHRGVVDGLFAIQQRQSSASSR
jgi:predicted AAA+ superfamily ATPase